MTFNDPSKPRWNKYILFARFWNTLNLVSLDLEFYRQNLCNTTLPVALAPNCCYFLSWQLGTCNAFKAFIWEFIKKDFWLIEFWISSLCFRAFRIKYIHLYIYAIFICIQYIHVHIIPFSFFIPFGVVNPTLLQSNSISSWNLISKLISISTRHTYTTVLLNCDMFFKSRLEVSLESKVTNSNYTNCFI